MRADKLLLAGLRLGIRETLDFLTTAAPSFEEFEAWVLAKNGGDIEPERSSASMRPCGAMAASHSKVSWMSRCFLGMIWLFGTSKAMS
jgi:hypothetical protein